MSLFQAGDFKLHSGARADFLIECAALTQQDIFALAEFIGRRMKFGSVEGVPRGGLRLANALEDFCGRGGPLIVDDVLTSGASMEKQRGDREGAQGVVIFARGPYPTWIRPVFVIPGRWS